MVSYFRPTTPCAKHGIQALPMQHWHREASHWQHRLVVMRPAHGIKEIKAQILLQTVQTHETHENSNNIATSNKCIASSNKCLTSSNKKLLVILPSMFYVNLKAFCGGLAAPTLAR